MKKLRLGWAAFLVLACGSVAAAQNMLPYGAQEMDQSSFAMGSMTWNVVLVEGDGSIQTQDESWTADEISNLQGKISDAAGYWEGLTSGFHQNAQLTIDINYVNGGNPLTTGYEPSNDRSEVWVNDVMGTLGYDNNSRFTNVRDFNQDSRVDNGTHWSTTIFVMDNTSIGNDRYAYAYFGGPYTILTHNAAGWQPENFNMVLAHEMGHIFFAHDEYAGSGRRVTDRGGYLNIENGNASRDADGNIIDPPQPNALMRNNGNFNTHVPYDPSVYTLGQVGHQDLDFDGIPDILDTTPDIVGDDLMSDADLGRFVFDGFSEVTTIENLNQSAVGFSNSQSDMTINTIADAYYRLNGGDAVFFGALDGAFDGYVEGLGFTIDGLAQGEHIIEIFSVNSVDNESSLTFSFQSALAVPEPAAATMLILAMAAAGMRRRRMIG